jgi:hypothetical protein
MDRALSSRANFQPTLNAISEDYFGYFKAVLNPSAINKKLGKYQPRLTYTQRPRGYQRAAYELVIELSLPKIAYGNNFDELTDTDFPRLVKQLRDTLKEMNIWLFTHQLEEAEVRAVHYSKNFVFTDYTSCSSVLQMLRTADISKTYDVQSTDFRNGGYVLHIHSNSLDIAIYDKLADLQQSKTSEKRAIEKDNYVQLDMLDLIAPKKPVSVMRYEVRLNGKKKTRDALAAVGFTEPLTLKSVYSAELAKKLLQNHWQNFFDNLPKLALDTDDPDKVLANILRSKELTGPTQAAARLGMALLLKDSEDRYVRTLFENRFGKHAWARLKPLTKQPAKVQYKTILNINKMLELFEPTKIEDIKDAI